MIVMVICSVNGLFLYNALSSFFSFLSINAYFLFILLHYQIIIIVASPTEEDYRKRTSLGKKRIWIWYLL